MNPSGHPNRAGRYERQTSGYQAFMPAPLPPEPPVRLEGELQRLLSRADRGLGRLDGSILEEITRQRRNRRFLYREYVDLFQDSPREGAGP